MSGLRVRIEAFFFVFGGWAFRNKFVALGISLTMMLILAGQVPLLKIDNSTETFFHKDDPAILVYEQFKDMFGKDDFFIIVLRPRAVFDLEFLDILVQLHEKLAAEVPYMADITSLVNVRQTRGEEDRLIVEKLMQKQVKTPLELAAFRKQVLSNPLYINSLVSADGRLTAILIQPRAYYMDSKESEHTATSMTRTLRKPIGTIQYAEMYDTMKRITDPYGQRDIDVFYAGNPVVTIVLDRAALADIFHVTPVAVIFVFLFLALMFRRVSGVLIPLVIVNVSLVSTLGVMAALGISLNVITNVLTTFLVVVGVADAVHILAIFYRSFQACGDKGQAIAEAFGHSGLAVLMTSLTTSAGLLSFTTADVASIADLGVIAPIGIMFAFFYTMLLLPAIVSLCPLGRQKPDQAKRSPGLDRIFLSISSFALNRPWFIIGISVIIFCLSCIGMTHLRLSHNVLNWFDEDHELRVSTTTIDEAMKGTLPIEFVIDTGHENGVYETTLMQKLDQSAHQLEQYQDNQVAVGKATSITTVVKEVNQALNENKPEFYSIPPQQAQIAQELLLFEMSGSDDLEDLVSLDYRQARLTLMVPFKDAILYKKVLADIKVYLQHQFPDKKIILTGIIPLFFETVQNILSSMIKSYLFAIVVITLLMILLIGTIRIGLLSMIPNLIPLCALVGIMGWLDIPFDFSTMLIGSIAIGLVVDDTIHFMHNFKRYFDQTGNVQLAVEKTMLTTGRAIFITSITLASGFFVHIIATMKISMIFGVLTGFTILLALVADFFLVPALMRIVFRDSI
ncbi:RND family transporter [candidate division CSSED10-310 bacterium]|uniref:RND family transporter n=1 Tax=candidate division CSSED10-310 bacterium TaxID=2855610 RepID=A0ABV6YRA2_UNCC1